MPPSMVLTVDDVVLGAPAWLLGPADPPMTPSPPMAGNRVVGSASSAPSADGSGGIA